MDLNWPKTGHWVLTIQGLHVYCKQNRKQLQNKNNVIWRSLGEKPGGSDLRDMDPSPLPTHTHTHSVGSMSGWPAAKLEGWVYTAGPEGWG